MTLNSQSNLAQCVWIVDSWDCWFCSDFGHNHATSMSEIQTLRVSQFRHCSDFGHSDFRQSLQFICSGHGDIHRYLRQNTNKNQNIFIINTAIEKKIQNENDTFKNVEHSSLLQINCVCVYKFCVGPQREGERGRDREDHSRTY